MTITSFQEAFAEITEAPYSGRIIALAESVAEIYFEQGRFREGDALALELEQFHASIEHLSAEEARAVLKDVVEWSRYCVKRARRRALNPNGR
jgi:hypothetical protein